MEQELMRRAWVVIWLYFYLMHDAICPDCQRNCLRPQDTI